MTRTIHYLRYNVRLEGGWLKDNLDVDLSADRLRKLKRMDRPASMPVLADLGARAAARQIEDHHFPAGFDPGD